VTDGENEDGDCDEVIRWHHFFL